MKAPHLSSLGVTKSPTSGPHALTPTPTHYRARRKELSDDSERGATRRPAAAGARARRPAAAAGARARRPAAASLEIEADGWVRDLPPRFPRPRRPPRLPQPLRLPPRCRRRAPPQHREGGAGRVRLAVLLPLRHRRLHRLRSRRFLRATPRAGARHRSHALPLPRPRALFPRMRRRCLHPLLDNISHRGSLPYWRIREECIPHQVFGLLHEE